MDPAILHAIWFDCPELSDTEHKLLLALAYHCHHGPVCYPSVRRLSHMIRRSERQTRTLLRQLEKSGHISIMVRRGRGKSNVYTLNGKSGRQVLSRNRKSMPPILQKIGTPDFLSKSEIQTSPELLLEEEKSARARDEKDGKKDAENNRGLRFLTPGSLAYHHANGTTSAP